MTDQATIDMLIEMWLTTMADAFRSQTMEPSMKGIPFEDRFGLLVDVKQPEEQPPQKADPQH